MLEWRCEHCGGSGVLHVAVYDPLARIETREYDSPCHACAAGAALAALDAIGTEGA